MQVKNMPLNQTATKSWIPA